MFTFIILTDQNRSRIPASEFLWRTSYNLHEHFFSSGKSSWLEDRFLVFIWGNSLMMSPSLWILSKWRSKTKLQLSNPETCYPPCSQTGLSSNIKGESWLILMRRQWLVYVIGLCYEPVSMNKISFVIDLLYLGCQFDCIWNWWRDMSLGTLVGDFLDFISWSAHLDTLWKTPG